MKKKWIFYLETFILTISFMIVILILSRMFVTSYRQSLYARDLNNTVHLSENLAEILRAADDEEELEELLKKEGMADSKGDHYEISYGKDLEVHEDGDYLFKIYYEKEDRLIQGKIEAYRGEEMIYDLEVGKYVMEGSE